jgi:hypothetical protein
LKSYHPRLRSRKDAEFVANDYNSCILTDDQLILDDESPASSPRGSKIAQCFYPIQVENFGDMLKDYAEALVTETCPRQPCGERFVACRSEWCNIRCEPTAIQSLHLHPERDLRIKCSTAIAMEGNWAGMLEQEQNNKKEAAEAK